MRLSNIRSKRAHIPDVNVQSFADTMEHVQADAVVFNEFLVGGFTDPGELDDVTGSVTSPLEEPPELCVADHARHLLM